MRKEFHEFKNHDSEKETLYNAAGIDNTEVYGESFEFTTSDEVVNKFKIKASGATDKFWAYLYYSVDGTFSTNDGYIDHIEWDNSTTDRYEYFFMSKPAYKSGHYRWGYASSGGSDTWTNEHTIFKSDKKIG